MGGKHQAPPPPFLARCAHIAKCVAAHHATHHVVVISGVMISFSEVINAPFHFERALHLLVAFFHGGGPAA